MRRAARWPSASPMPSASSATAAEFRELLRDHVDILFANEAEICSLWQVDSFERALGRPAANARPPH